VYTILNIQPLKKIDLVHSTMNTIRERIFQMSQLFFLKRDLTGSMGLLRHFPTDMVNSVIEELTNCQLIRQGREYLSINHSFTFVLLISAYYL